MVDFLFIETNITMFNYEFDVGIPPAFWKTPTLRVCKILYSFLANPITNENLKTHARIGMYKMMYRIIQKENAETQLYQRFVPFLCY
ncbi:hypothetical protein CN278_27975 [Bacillus thuringiensis]|nr:hypothetical protein CN278_27975 [Bacillus thuringiensis]PGQ23644.1 hypothetical protein COA11_24705 [Bacillus thuringiensis]